MPYVQPLPWTEFMACPICTHSFGFYRRHPISLGCGHSVCRLCLASLYNQQCPFDQSPINVDHKNLPVNSALLKLASLRKGESHTLSEILNALPPSCARELTPDDLRYYFIGKGCIEHMAVHLYKAIGNAENPLSRSMQRKLVTLINCQLMTEEGRLRAMRVSRCIGERAVIEMIMRQQKPVQLNACLWAAVRGRGCQFLGPVLQEDLLRHLLAVLAGGVALSRKSLVMQVVQSLKAEYAQASKTSVGHVVQLLYRASCFNVSKRECESSLMQLKEEFSTYDSLRQEHDAQIVQIAMEAGLRIPPEQWSTLLYGDLLHKSYMQSIIDRLQTPESFKQSIQELVLTLQRNGDIGEFENMRPELQDLANIEISSDKPSPTSWQELGKALQALKKVIDGFVEFEIRARKHHEERRFNHRNVNGASSFSHSARNDMEPFRNEHFRNLTDNEQANRTGRTMIRNGSVGVPSFTNSVNLQHSNFPHFRHGTNVGLTLPMQNRFERQQRQLNRATSLFSGRAQMTSIVRSVRNNIPNLNQTNTNININGNGNGSGNAGSGTLPGFEDVRLSTLNEDGSNPGSSSIYSNNRNNSNISNSINNKNTPRSLNEPMSMSAIQALWAQRANININDRQNLLNLQNLPNLQLNHLPNGLQSSSVDSVKTLRAAQENSAGQSQGTSAINSVGQSELTSMDDVEYANGVSVDLEERERRQIEELQDRFNQVLFNTVVNLQERSSSVTDSGVNSSSFTSGNPSEFGATNVNSIFNNEKSISQQALPYQSWRSNQALNVVDSLFSNSYPISDRNITDSCSNMKSCDFSNSDPLYSSGQQSDIKLDSPHKSAASNFVMEFPKSSQHVNLELPNISTETLRNIWQVPPDKPERKTVEEIWKPISPRGAEQKSENQDNNLKDIWIRQQDASSQMQNSLSDSQSNSLGSESGVDSSCSDWMFHRNYSCMEAAYSKIAERYPSVGIGPWTDCSNFIRRYPPANRNGQYYNGGTNNNNTNNANNNSNGNNNTNNANNNNSNNTSGGDFNMRETARRSPEPSSLGLSRLRLLGCLGGMNEQTEHAAATITPIRSTPPPSPQSPTQSPSPTRQSALDAAIETYWKDAMETSLGLNAFLPPAKDERFPYPAAESNSVPQTMSTVSSWGDEFMQIPGNISTPIAKREASGLFNQEVQYPQMPNPEM